MAWRLWPIVDALAIADQQAKLAVAGGGNNG
jgi:hypothetical protein